MLRVHQELQKKLRRTRQSWLTGGRRRHTTSGEYSISRYLYWGRVDAFTHGTEPGLPYLPLRQGNTINLSVQVDDQAFAPTFPPGIALPGTTESCPDQGIEIQPQRCATCKTMHCLSHYHTSPPFASCYTALMLVQVRTHLYSMRRPPWVLWAFLRCETS